jgi:hypothetical protein
VLALSDIRTASCHSVWLLHDQPLPARTGSQDLEENRCNCPALRRPLDGRLKSA